MRPFVTICACLLCAAAALWVQPANAYSGISNQLRAEPLYRATPPRKITPFRLPRPKPAKTPSNEQKPPAGPPIRRGKALV
jgi:hypothetical protein